MKVLKVRKQFGGRLRIFPYEVTVQCDDGKIRKLGIQDMSDYSWTVEQYLRNIRWDIEDMIKKEVKKKGTVIETIVGMEC